MVRQRIANPRSPVQIWVPPKRFIKESSYILFKNFIKYINKLIFMIMNNIFLYLCLDIPKFYEKPLIVKQFCFLELKLNITSLYYYSGFLKCFVLEKIEYFSILVRFTFNFTGMFFSKTYSKHLNTLYDSILQKT